MPTYQVESPDGRKYRLEGDGPPPDDAELEKLFGSTIPGKEATALGQLPTELFTIPDATKAQAESEVSAANSVSPEEFQKRYKSINDKYDYAIRAASDGMEESPTSSQRVAKLMADRDAEMQAIGIHPVRMDGEPRLPRLTSGESLTLTGGNQRLANVLKAGQNTAAGFGESLATPEGGMMLGPKAVAMPIARAFLPEMAAAVPAKLGEALGAYSGGDVGTGDTALTEGLATGAMLALPAAAARLERPLSAAETLANQIERAPLESVSTERPIQNALRMRPGISPNALDLPEARAVVERGLREIQSPIVTGDATAADAIRAARIQLAAETPEPTRLKEDAGGGKISFEAEAGAEAVPSARQSAPDASVEPAARNVGKEIGFDVKPNGLPGVSTEGMPPEMLAELRKKYPVQWEFTDRRPDSPTSGLTFYVPEGATRDQILKRLDEKKTELSEGVISKLEGLKAADPLKGNLSAFGLVQSVWNTAIDIAIGAVKAGKSAAEAIDAAMKHIRFNAKGFDEAAIRNHLTGMLANEPTSPRVEGGETRMRRSAARATTSEDVPQAVQERIATAPESFYQSQKMKSVEETVGRMTDSELASVDPKSNIHVASKLELAKRLFDVGKLEEGYQVFKSVSKTGTDFGQNINQFKMLNGQHPINIVHIANEGLKEAGRDPLTKKQAEDLARTADTSMKDGEALKRAEAEWVEKPTDVNAAKAEAALKASNDADLATQRHLNQFKVKTWPQMLKTFAQGNPLTPISHAANFFGNTLGAVMEGSSRNAGAFIDAVRSMLTSEPRKLMVRPVANAVAAARGFSEGSSKAPSIMLRGTGDVVKGEARAGLQPLRAFKAAFAKDPGGPTIKGEVPFNERVRLAVEGTFGIAPETMLRLLSAADKPAYESARARLISEASELNRLTPEQRKMAQKFPELVFDRKEVSRINDEAADAIFQRPSKSIQYLQSMIREKGGDWGDLAFTILVAPYKLTPWNLVVRTIQYNPVVAMANTALKAAKGDVRGAELNAGRMVVGTMLYGAGYFLYKYGLIGPSLEDRDEGQKVRLLAGQVLPPNHVNVSGLQRLVKGEDPNFKPGDETWDLTRGGGAAGAILTSVANIGRDFEKSPKPDTTEWATSLLKNSTLQQASFTVNQSFLKGVTGILDAIQNRNLAPYINSVESMVLNIPTPNTLSTLSRATRENVPDLKGDAVENVIRNRFGIMGADDYLPVKRDLFGEPMKQTPEGRNALIYHLFDLSKNQQVTDDPVKLEMYRLWRKTDDASVIPSIPERTITVARDQYNLDPAQYSRYAELVGKNRKLILDNIIKEKDFATAPDEVKVKILDRANQAGAGIGKALFVQEAGALTPRPKKSGFTPATP